MNQAPNDADTGKTIELLPLFQPRVHVVAGKWEFDKAVLSIRNDEPFSRVVFPYLPPEEYDLKVLFTPENDNPIDVILAHNRIDFFFEMASTFAAFALCNGKAPGDKDNPSRIKAANLYFSGGAMMELSLTVRNYRVSASLNGRKIVDHETDYYDLGIDHQWRLPLPALGIGGFNALARFHAVTVKEVTGTGFVLPVSAFHR